MKNKIMFLSLQIKELSRDIKRFVSSRVVEAASEAFSERPPPSECSAFPNRSLLSLAELLMREVCPSSWVWRSPFLAPTRLLLSHWLEQRLAALAAQLWSAHSALVLLRMCRVALAPGALPAVPTREKGHRALSSVLVFPTWMTLALGGSAVAECRDLLLRAFACETSNRQLALDAALSATYLLTN